MHLSQFNPNLYPGTPFGLANASLLATTLGATDKAINLEGLRVNIDGTMSL